MPFKANEEIIVAEAHCDGPCGVYDPASARVAAEAVQSMTKRWLLWQLATVEIVAQRHTSTQCQGTQLSRKKKHTSASLNYWFCGLTLQATTP